MSDDQQHFNSRSFERGAVTIPAEIREIGAGKQSVSVIDLSQSGFRMRCIFLIGEGRTVFLTIPGFQSLEAIVAWHHDEYYGCRFVRPLHEAIYDHIIRSYPSLGGRL
ncbi:MAG TPA: PilZ domain-containing protein [Sphingorhabdus sp.]|nr:PilZ domain-containing protein [Sphingorhabdus sp.]